MARPRIEVVYATRDRQDSVMLELEEGACAVDALHASRFLERYPDLDARTLKLGVYGKEVSPETKLADGDRVELYRPLTLDPKDARRARARRTLRR